MQFSPLAAVKHRIEVGRPLPFNVRDADGTLLLAREHIVDDHDHLEALFARGALVDLAELRTPQDLIRAAPPEMLPGLWAQCFERVAQTLQRYDGERFAEALDVASGPVMSLVQRDPDLAIFQVLRQDDNPHTQYGVNHAVHAAIACHLVAQRLGWEPEAAQRAFKVALTMDLSMIELHGELAAQATPLTPEQRESIYAHPQRSVEMLRLAGIDDEAWLMGVAHHHVAPDGSGYPAGHHAVNDYAALARRADIYTAKLAPRATREAMGADRAGRAMFMSDPGNSMTVALVKEFGVYPPGCFVKLASGETAIVVRRGATVITPRVAVLTTPSGMPLAEPAARDTSRPEHAIVAVVAERTVTYKPKTERLMTLALA